jgi:hypothetical protein
MELQRFLFGKTEAGPGCFVSGGHDFGVSSDGDFSIALLAWRDSDLIP